MHPVNVLMCPHTCILNLPKPREHHPGGDLFMFFKFNKSQLKLLYWYTEREVGPGAVLAGSIVQGRRLAEAKGREIFDDDSDTAKKVFLISTFSMLKTHRIIQPILT